MKEAPNQKVQEKKPLLKFKNTKKYMCLERIWRKKCFWACRHRPLMVSEGLKVSRIALKFKSQLGPKSEPVQCTEPLPSAQPLPSF